MSTYPTHPVVPLTVNELNAVGAQLRLAVPDITNNALIVAERPVVQSIQLQEPDKNVVIMFNEGLITQFERRSISYVYFPEIAKTRIFIHRINYIGQIISSVVEESVRLESITPGMDQYIFDPYVQWPVWGGDIFPGTMATTCNIGAPWKSVAQTIIDGYNNNVQLAWDIVNALVERLRLEGTESEKVAVILKQLEMGTLRPDYLGGFEAARNAFNQCNATIQEMVSAGGCEPAMPRHRYAPFFFRYFPGPQSGPGIVAPNFDTYGPSPYFESRSENTPVVNVSGLGNSEIYNAYPNGSNGVAVPTLINGSGPAPSAPIGGVGVNASPPGSGYYESLNRLEGILVLADLTDHILVDLALFSKEDDKTPDIKPDIIYRPKHGWQSSIRPLVISTPEGSSFNYNVNPISGLPENNSLIQFDNWSMRLSWDHVAGVQLYNVTWSDTEILDRFDDSGNLIAQAGDKIDRTVLYKMSLTDCFVYYAVGNPFFRRNFPSTDSASYPVARRLIPLIPGKHVPADARLITVNLADMLGQAGQDHVNNNPRAGCSYFTAAPNPNVTLTNAVGIFERDGDMITAFTTGGVITMRGRELVVRSVFQGLFYLWTFDFIFCQDGTIKCETQVSGRVAVGHRLDNPTSPYGNYVTRNYFGLAHQHMYCYRFDFDIDVSTNDSRGTENLVEIEETLPWDRDCDPCKCEDDGKCHKKHHKKHCKKSCKKTCSKSKLQAESQLGHEDFNLDPLGNPSGNAAFLYEKHLHTELEAATDVDISKNRIWVVKNPNSNLRFNSGEKGDDIEPIHRGYAIQPRANGKDISQNWSWMRTHAGFIKHNFFATPYMADEQYAIGNNPILQDTDVGLASWIKQDRNILNTDVVCWYNINFAHGCHTEDFPSIPYAPQGVDLVPHNFYEWNPASTINNAQGVINANKYKSAVNGDLIIQPL